MKTVNCTSAITKAVMAVIAFIALNLVSTESLAQGFGLHPSIAGGLTHPGAGGMPGSYQECALMAGRVRGDATLGSRAIDAILVAFGLATARSNPEASFGSGIALSTNNHGDRKQSIEDSYNQAMDECEERFGDSESGTGRPRILYDPTGRGPGWNDTCTRFGCCPIWNIGCGKNQPSGVRPPHPTRPMLKISVVSVNSQRSRFQSPSSSLSGMTGL